MSDEKKKPTEEILSMTDDVLANLSIEELEERLEMQILAVPTEEDFGGCVCKGVSCYLFKEVPAASDN